MSTLATRLRIKWEELLPEPFLLFVLGWFAGGLAYFYPDQKAEMWRWGLIVIVSGVAMIVSFQKQWDSGLKTTVFISGMALGVLYSQYYTRSIQDDLPKIESRSTSWKVEGTVSKVEPLRQDRYRIVLSDLIIAEKSVPKAKIRITMGIKLRKGDRIDVLARLYPPSPAVVPGGYDFQRRAFFDRIIAVGYAVAEPWILDRQPADFASIWQRLRMRIYQTVARDFPSDTGTLMRTLLLGDRQGLSEQQWQTFRHSGLAHLLAISGMHIGMIAFTVYALIRAIAALIPRIILYYPVHRYAAGLAVIAAAGYVGLAGEAVSINRAFMMIAVIMLGIMLETDTIRFRSMAIAAMIIMLWRPEVVISSSFQLSFGAVWVLVAYFQFPHRFGQNLPKLLKAIVDIAVSSLWVTVIMLPMLWWHFGEIYPWGALGNILAIPWMAFVVMPLVFLYFFAAQLGIGEVVAPLLERSLSVLYQWASFIADMPTSQLSLPLLSLSSMLILMGCGFWVIMFYQQNSLRSLLLPVGVASIVVILAIQVRPVDLIIDRGESSIVYLQDGEVRVHGDRPSGFIARQWRRYFQSFISENTELYGQCDDDRCLFQKGETTLVVHHHHPPNCSAGQHEVRIQPFSGCSFSPKQLKLWQQPVVFIRFLDSGDIEVTASTSGKRPWQQLSPL